MAAGCSLARQAVLLTQLLTPLLPLPAVTAWSYSLPPAAALARDVSADGRSKMSCCERGSPKHWLSSIGWAFCRCETASQRQPGGGGLRPDAGPLRPVN